MFHRAPTWPVILVPQNIDVTQSGHGILNQDFLHGVSQLISILKNDLEFSLVWDYSNFTTLIVRKVFGEVIAWARDVYKLKG